KTRNLQALSALFQTLPSETRVVFLPELFATGFSMNARLAEPMDGSIVAWMRTASAHFRKVICGSVMIEEEGIIYNRLVWMQPDGVSYHYDKRHLFAYGGEEKVFSPGSRRLMVQ